MALAIDASTPAIFDLASGLSSVTSNPFTPPNNSLIAVFWGNGRDGTTPNTCTDSASALSFTQITSVGNAASGAVSIFLAQCPVSPGSITVTVSWTADAGSGRYVLPVVITGASTAAPGSWPGAKNSVANTASVAASLSLTPNFSNSLLLGVFQNGASQTAPTLLGNNSDSLNSITQFTSDSSTSSGCFVAQYTGTVTGGVSATMGDSAPASVNDIALIEIPSGVSAVPSTFSVSDPEGTRLPGIH